MLMPRAPSFPTVSSIAKTTGPTTFAKTRSPKKPPTASSSPDYSKNASCTFVSFVYHVKLVKSKKTTGNVTLFLLLLILLFINLVSGICRFRK